MSKLLFNSCDRVPHIAVGEDEDVEDVEEDAEDADDQGQVQVDCVVEILLNVVGLLDFPYYWIYWINRCYLIVSSPKKAF